tara:strand:- start:891 stop:1583 length:693 start_codon:yes stop_codon:yes gene_type:complete
MEHDKVMIEKIKLDVSEWMSTFGQIQMGEESVYDVMKVIDDSVKTTLSTRERWMQSSKQETPPKIKLERKPAEAVHQPKTLSTIQRLTLLYIKGEYRTGRTALKDVPALVSKIEPVKKTRKEHMSAVYKTYDGVLFDWHKGGQSTVMGKPCPFGSGALYWYPEVSKIPEEFVRDRAFHHQVFALSNYIKRGCMTTKEADILDKMRQSLLTGCPNGHLSDFLECLNIKRSK